MGLFAVYGCPTVKMVVGIGIRFLLGSMDGADLVLRWTIETIQLEVGAC